MSSSKPPTITLRKRKYTHSLNENWTYEYYLSLYTGPTGLSYDKGIEYIIRNIQYHPDSNKKNI